MHGEPCDLDQPVTRTTATRRRTALLAVSLGAGLVAVLPSAAHAVTPTPPALPSGVEDLQPYVGQTGCDPVAKPGVLAFQALLMRTYPDTGSLGIVRDCGIGGQSEHKEGRAFDWAVSVDNPQQVAEVQAVTDWLTAYSGPDFASNARRFGIMYMIWNHHIWESYRPTAGWQDYTGPIPHTDHVHFSFGWNGAYAATSWWSGTVAPLSCGPYVATCGPAPVPPPPPTGTPTPPDPIDAKHTALGGDTGLLGPATGPEQPVLGGLYRPYLYGAIYTSPTTGTHEVHGAIATQYLGTGGSHSPLGLPTSDEGAVPGGGRGNTFQYGDVDWSATTGAHSVYGAIDARYRQLGGSATALGLPTGEEGDVPGGRALSFQGGTVAWSPTTGAHEVYGAIFYRWAAMGGAAGPFGLPLTGEVGVTAGRANVFQRGSVYWSTTTGAHEVHGDIRARYLSDGGSAVVGLPLTDESDAPGGRTNAFTYGGIWWSYATGAHLVHGLIGARYVQDGGPSVYGMPLGEEYASPIGRTQDFTLASLDFNGVTGEVTVRPHA